MKYFKKIVGERLYLSPMNVEDAETYVKWMSDRSVTDNLGNTRSVCTLPGEKEYIESRKSSDYDFSQHRGPEIQRFLGMDRLFKVSLISTIGAYFMYARKM